VTPDTHLAGGEIDDRGDRRLDAVRNQAAASRRICAIGPAGSTAEPTSLLGRVEQLVLLEFCAEESQENNKLLCDRVLDVPRAYLHEIQ